MKVFIIANDLNKCKILTPMEFRPLIKKVNIVRSGTSVSGDILYVINNPAIIKKRWIYVDEKGRNTFARILRFDISDILGRRDEQFIETLFASKQSIR